MEQFHQKINESDDNNWTHVFWGSKEVDFIILYHINCK